MGIEKGRVLAVCLSPDRGPKAPVEEAWLEPGQGLCGDAHSGTERPVSLLRMESVEAMRSAFSGEALPPWGAFGENLRVRGLEMDHLSPGNQLIFSSGVVLECVKQGKDCHNPCAIHKAYGCCAMPGEGVFARTLAGGRLRPGDVMEVRKCE